MVATVDESGLKLALVKPSERRDTVLKPYIAYRLREECDPPVGEKRGRAAAIAGEIGFRPAHVSAVKDEKRGISDDFVVAIAKHWRVSLPELDRLADEHAERQGVAAGDDVSPRARLMRLVEEVARERGGASPEQLSRAFSLVAFGGNITRRDVEQAFDRERAEPESTVDAELEHAHHAKRARGKRRR